MPKGKAGSGRQDVPRPFYVSYDMERRGWAVIQGERRRYAADVCIQVTVTTAGGRLTGVGVVRCMKRGELVITA